MWAKLNLITVKKNEDSIKSQIYQFNEFSEEPIILEKFPNIKDKKEKNNDIIGSELEITTEILDNYDNMAKDINTIDKILEMLKKSYNITQVFPFLIQKITNEESNKLFNILYSIYVSYVDYNKKIISEDSLRFCFLFENLCKKIKNEVDLDEYEEIKDLETDTNIESLNLNEYRYSNK